MEAQAREDQSFLDNMANKALDQSVQEFKRGDRDPNNVNGDVRVVFEDIIAEPDDYHSSKYTWNMSTFIFNWGKDAAYQFFSFVFGVPLSLFWGCFFAMAACMNVWVYSPLKRSQSIKMGCWKQFLTVLLSVVFDPLFESAGKTFSKIDVQHTTEKITID
jgi:hypothetical protein